MSYTPAHRGKCNHGKSLRTDPPTEDVYCKLTEVEVSPVVSGVTRNIECLRFLVRCLL